MGQFLKVMCAALILFAMRAGGAFAQSPEIGEIIENVAYVSYDKDGKIVTVATPPAKFEVEALRTPSEVRFYRSAPAAPDAQLVNIAETQYSPSKSLSGPFVDYEQPFPFPNAQTDAALGRIAADVKVIPNEHFHAGDIMIVSVKDIGQNGNPNRRECLTIHITTTSGDEIVVRLYESGTNTGIFWGYIFTEKDSGQPNETTIDVKSKDKITATYNDEFDSQEVTSTIALVDPNGRLFDSTTGELLSGIRVGIVQADSGLPGEVYGADGFSRYPSELVTGGTVTDESGKVYALDPGEFLFPLMPPGRYRLELDVPPGYLVPSLAKKFDGLANSPFDISEASYSLEFHLDGTGPITFDVPMDPSAEVSLEKSSEVSSAAIGDFVPYQVKLTNARSTGARVILRDTAAHGFRVIRSSMKLDGQPIPDDQVRLTGSTFYVIPPVIPSGNTMELSYVMEVAAGAQNGLNRNSIVAVDGQDREISNVADADVFVEEDLLRSRSTIVGRVTADSCEAEGAPDEADALDSVGIEGVRIYLETGEYAVTDDRGFYHFEQVKPGTHVVRMDDGVLPQGVSAIKCDGETRPNASFVDLMGGVVWRANFQLQRQAVDTPVAAPQIFNDSVEHKFYDMAWLDAQEPGLEWVYPDPSRTPSTNSINVGIKHDPANRIELWLNGTKLRQNNFSGSETSTDGKKAISRWRSVDIEDGRNQLEAHVLNAEGTVVQTLIRELWYIEKVTRAHVVQTDSELVADGQSQPVLAIRFTDDGGRAVHAGRMVSVNVEAPYQIATSGEIGDGFGLARSLADEGGVAVGGDGIARIRLEPTLQSGIVTLRVELDNGRVERLRAYLKPAPRPWIVVGLAEVGIGSGAPLADGTGSSKDAEIGASSSDLDPFADGRLAVYAKGEIGNGWQATLAIDTDKRRGSIDQGFNQEIDPSAAYNLFGDKSYQQQDAASRYPVYGKLEKDQFMALFGDYNTDLQDTQLSAYSRQLSGLKIVQSKDRYDFSLFAAETNQNFNSDELPADGTSGPYQLSVAPILGQSEKVTIETRDRLRPDQILNERVLQRYLDYDLDYRTGLLVFRAPVDATDNAFNPNVIVVDYETSEESERHITAGGRLAARFAKGALELGATVIHEGGSGQAAGQDSDLIGFDATLAISENTELRAEYARSTTRQPAVDDTNGDAVLVELTHQSENLAVSTFVRQENTGFGVGQTQSNTEDVRRVGVKASYMLGQSDAAETGERTTRSVQAEITREDNLSTGEFRESASAVLQQSAESFTVDAGLRYAREELTDDVERRSILLTGGVQKRFEKLGLTASVRHEQPLDQQNLVSLFPKRTVFGIDKSLTDFAQLTARHEIIDGENASGENTVLGLILQPWTGAEIRSELDQVSNESGKRIGATFGIDQSIQLSDDWSVSLGAARRANVDQNEDAQDPVADGVKGPLELAPSTILTASEEFFSGYAGLAFRQQKMAASTRLEVRDTDKSTRYTAVASAARQVTEELTFAAAARTELDQVKADEDSKKLDVRLAAAYRPTDDGPIVFDRLDLKSDRRGTDYKSERIVNNAAVSIQLNSTSQGSLFVGTKYQQTMIGDDSYSGWTHLVGGQYRQQITDKIDVGLTASAMHSMRSGTTEYSYGPSVGYRPHEDVWISAGWNVEGFADEDFEAAEYSHQGPYIKVRMKFDEHTTSEILDRLGF